MVKVQGWVCAVAAVTAIVFALAMTSTASAASARLTLTGIRYDADAGEANDVEATTDGRVLQVREFGVTSIDTSRLPSFLCTDVADATTGAVGFDCKLPGDIVLTADLGDGDDWFDGTYLPKRVALNVDAGDGDNVVEGGAGDDRIVGGAGADTLYGDRGDDVIRAGDGFNWVRAGAGDDTITTGSDFDFVFGDGGDDVLNAGAEDDYVYGGNGDDTLNAGPGNDLLDGENGDDELNGQAGDDVITGGKGKDELNGGAGADELDSLDQGVDTDSCGAGADIAHVDQKELKDARKDCETITLGDLVTPAPPADDDTEATNPDGRPHRHNHGGKHRHASDVAGHALIALDN